MYRCLLATFSIVALLAPGAYAQDFARSGPYLGIAGSIVIPTDLESGIDLASGGLQARAGYRFHPNLAAELRYEWIQDFTPSFFSAREDISPWTLMADGRVHLLTGRFQPLLIAGMGIMHAKREGQTILGRRTSSESTSFAARFGAGIDIYATDRIAFGFDISYVLPTGSLEDLDYLSFGLGVQYRF